MWRQQRSHHCTVRSHIRVEPTSPRVPWRPMRSMQMLGATLASLRQGTLPTYCCSTCLCWGMCGRPRVSRGCHGPQHGRHCGAALSGDAFGRAGLDPRDPWGVVQCCGLHPEGRRLSRVPSRPTCVQASTAAWRQTRVWRPIGPTYCSRPRCIIVL